MKRTREEKVDKERKGRALVWVLHQWTYCSGRTLKDLAL